MYVRLKEGSAEIQIEFMMEIYSNAVMQFEHWKSRPAPFQEINP
jgi:hypothetical protein